MKRADWLAELKIRGPEILPHQSLRWEEAGSILHLSWNGQHVRLAPRLLSRPGLAALKELAFPAAKAGKPSDPIPLVVAPYLGEEARKFCRSLGLLYLDLSGSVWIERGPLLIEKEALRSRYSREAAHRSPFADAASLILRYLLGRVGHKNAAGVREIAGGVGVSPGYVSKMLHEAEQARYVQRSADDRFVIKNPRELLGDWSASYRWQKNNLQAYFLAPDRSGGIEGVLADVLKARNGYALSLHAGNNRIEPFAPSPLWHLYVESDAVARQLEKRLSLKPVDLEAGNVVFMRPWYRKSAFHGVRKVRGLWVVSDLQLYLDLRHYPVRGLEAADQILQRRLSRAWKLEGNHARV